MKFDNVCSTETHLPDRVQDSEQVCENYLVFRCDRQHGRGGGVVIAARKDLSRLS